MSFTISMQFNHSERERMDKEITDVFVMTGELRSQCSITDPDILINYDGTLTGVNYMTIPTMGRSYFITGIEVVRTGLWRVTGHVDVISTYKQQIRANTAVIHRQQNNWNMYLDDGIFKTYQNPMIITKAFPSGFTTQEFVLAIAGG